MYAKNLLYIRDAQNKRTKQKKRTKAALFNRASNDYKDFINHFQSFEIACDEFIRSLIQCQSMHNIEAIDTFHRSMTHKYIRLADEFNTLVNNNHYRLPKESLSIIDSKYAEFERKRDIFENFIGQFKLFIKEKYTKDTVEAYLSNMVNLLESISNIKDFLILKKVALQKLKKARKRILKVVHPDVSDTDSAEAAAYLKLFHDYKTRIKNLIPIGSTRDQYITKMNELKEQQTRYLAQIKNRIVTLDHEITKFQDERTEQNITQTTLSALD